MKKRKTLKLLAVFSGLSIVVHCIGVTTYATETNDFSQNRSDYLIPDKIEKIPIFESDILIHQRLSATAKQGRCYCSYRNYI